MNSINILLVEDEAPKRSHIERFLLSQGMMISIRESQSVSSALSALDESVPDLLLLDMSLPTFDIGDRESGGRPQGFGGIEVLRYMSMTQLICPTIVITGYEAFLREEGPVDLSQLRAELKQEFPEFLKSVLHYNSTYAGWKTELGEALREFSISRGGSN